MQRRDPERGVLKMRRGDDDGVHLTGFDEFLAVGEILSGLYLSSLRNASDMTQFRSVDLPALDMRDGAADIAHPDNAQTDFFHAREFSWRHQKCQ